MKHILKLQTMDALRGANKMLCTALAATSFCCLLLSAAVFFKEENWVLVPSYSPEKRLSVSSGVLSENYLREWAEWVARIVLTTSSETVEGQIQEVGDVSVSTKALASFFRRHVDFVKGSRIESVFFPKQYKFEDNAVIVSGNLRYWLGTQLVPVTQEKQYRLSYRRAAHGVLLLSGFEDLEGDEV